MRGSVLVVGLLSLGLGLLVGVQIGRSGASGGDPPPETPPAQAPPAIPSTGMWHPAPARVIEDAAARGAFDEMANLPYTGGSTAAPAADSITVHLPAAEDGLNLVVSGHAPIAELQDMDGRVLHTWTKAFAEVWPTPPGHNEAPVHRTFWRRARVDPDGNLLAIFEGYGLIKLDADSELVWAYDGRAHHDIDVTSEGEICVPTRHWIDDPRDPDRTGPPTLLQGSYYDDCVTFLDAGGHELRSVSVLECFENSDYAYLLAFAPRHGDLLHVNTVEVMDGRHAAVHPLFAKGNVLLSMPTFHTIAVLDPDARKVVWAAGGLTRYQHEPTVLDDATILIFDNLGAPPRGGVSRVVALDPVTMTFGWTYEGTAEAPFSSFRLGSVQRLRGGNTLITESVNGRAFEVTPDGGIVWELINPHRAGADGELIATLFDVVRRPRDFFSADFASRLR